MGTPASGYVFKSFAGFMSPEVRQTIENYGGADGTVASPQYYGKRVFRINGEIWGTSLADYEEKRIALTNAFVKGLETVTFTSKAGSVYTSDVYISGEVESAYEAGSAIISSYRIELYSSFPFIKGALHETVIGVYTGGGMAIPTAIPMSIAEGGQGATIISNTGNYTAYPVITMNGALINPVITNITNGQSVSYSGTIASGSSVIIDTYNKTAVTNNGTNIRANISGFPTIEKGDNIFTLTDQGNSSVASAIIAYNDTYVGI